MLAQTVQAAVADIAAHGFDSMERINRWVRAIRQAAAAEAMSSTKVDELLRQTFGQVYRRQIDQGAILRHHPGVSRFTVEKLKPSLRAELDRRKMASAQLIKLNRDAAIERTIQRFSGWASSVPAGGSDVVDRNQVKADIKKSMTSLSFVERRVAIDQGHKFTAALSSIIAHDTGAIAGRWHSHWRQAGYNYRVDHKDRDDEVYAVKGSWALERGLINKGAGYTDEMTQPAEEPYCRCYYQWLYNLRELPKEMLTRKGEEALAAVRLKA